MSNVVEMVYRIPGPALISFSGGRTSAYMLHQILQAYGGTLPDDVVVAFANTGKEREETLEFVRECADHWSVPVRWVEWRNNEKGFEEVTFETASRNGEPFADLIRKKNFLPNAVTRYCTTKLKVETMKKLMLSLGHQHWNNAVGLRYDEGHRVLKQLARNDEGKERWISVMPLSKAKVTKKDVMAFWSRQNFDLRLMPYEGNCDLCFLKNRAKLQTIMRERPGLADWWIAQETAVSPNKPSGGRFGEESYAALQDQVTRQGFLPFFDDGDEYDAECGLWCGHEGTLEAAE